MKINITTREGLQVSRGIHDILWRVWRDLENKSGKVLENSLVEVTRDHVQQRYPGSEHWSPSKITGAGHNGSAGQADVAIPGAARAYHDVTIRPVHAKALAIPMHREAFGLKPREIPGLFVLKSSSGSAFLAKNDGGSLTLMYSLAKSAFQKQDSSLMPSDDKLADDMFASLKALGL